MTWKAQFWTPFILWSLGSIHWYVTLLEVQQSQWGINHWPKMVLAPQYCLQANQAERVLAPWYCLELRGAVLPIESGEFEQQIVYRSVVNLLWVCVRVGVSVNSLNSPLWAHDSWLESRGFWAKLWWNCFPKLQEVICFNMFSTFAFKGVRFRVDMLKITTLQTKWHD